MSTEQRGPGRPSLPDTEGKRKTIGFRVEAKEHAAIEQAASIAGMKLSDWVRARLSAAAAREIKRAGQ